MKKIISLISAAAMLLTVSSFSFVAHADSSAQAFVNVVDQNESFVTIEFGIKTTELYFTGVQFGISGIDQTGVEEYKDGFVNTSMSTWANKGTSDLMYIPKNPAGTAKEYNTRLYTVNYEAYSSLTGSFSYDTNDNMFKASMGYTGGASMPADGVLWQIKIPVNGEAVEEKDVKIEYCRFTSTDFVNETSHGYGDTSITGVCAESMSVVGSVLKGAEEEADATAEIVGYKPAVRTGFETCGVVGTANTADSKYVQIKFTGAKNLLAIDLGTVIDNVPVTFGLNIMSVPAGTKLAIEDVKALSEEPADAVVVVAE